MSALYALSEGAWAALNGIAVAVVGAVALVVSTMLSRGARQEARNATRTAAVANERAARVEGASAADREQIAHLLEAITAANNERDTLAAQAAAEAAGRAAAEEALRLCEEGRRHDRATADLRFGETRHALANLAMELQAIAQAVRATTPEETSTPAANPAEAAIHRRAEAYRQQRPPKEA